MYILQYNVYSNNNIDSIICTIISRYRPTVLGFIRLVFVAERYHPCFLGEILRHRPCAQRPWTWENPAPRERRYVRIPRRILGSFAPVSVGDSPRCIWLKKRCYWFTWFNMIKHGSTRLKMVQESWSVKSILSESDQIILHMSLLGEDSYPMGSGSSYSTWCYLGWDWHPTMKLGTLWCADNPLLGANWLKFSPLHIMAHIKSDRYVRWFNLTWDLRVLSILSIPFLSQCST